MSVRVDSFSFSLPWDLPPLASRDRKAAVAAATEMLSVFLHSIHPRRNPRRRHHLWYYKTDIPKSLPHSLSPSKTRALLLGRNTFRSRFSKREFLKMRHMHDATPCTLIFSHHPPSFSTYFLRFLFAYERKKKGGRKETRQMVSQTIVLPPPSLHGWLDGCPVLEYPTR